jgi:hypothetical protein
MRISWLILSLERSPLVSMRMHRDPRCAGSFKRFLCGLERVERAGERFLMIPTSPVGGTSGR